MERCMMPETRMTVTIYNYYGPKEIDSPLIKHLLSPSRVFQTRCALKPEKSRRAHHFGTLRPMALFFCGLSYAPKSKIKCRREPKTF
jgi:hypothetical protein